MTKIIALYLPQYHEFEENNMWWGKGFTEWTCVNKAVSHSENHRIKKPHEDIGYYSLLDKEVRAKQAKIAKNYGVYGFCYYHYWFGDKVLMDSVLKMMLEDGEPDIPFCLSWANEPWTKRMNGGSGELLQANNYGSEEEWERHLQYLIPFFRNDNYIKIDGKPVFVIYRVAQIPEYRRRFDYWRFRMEELGFGGIFLVMTVGNFLNDDFSSMIGSLDASFDFYPNFLWQSEMIERVVDNKAFYDMGKVYERILRDAPVHPTHFKGTMVGFDSSPRSPAKSNIFTGGSPELFEKNMKQILVTSGSEFVFVNAWNEWGEGCALEPEEVDGYGYLESLRRSRKALIKLC
jgi:hypothetical protein